VQIPVEPANPASIVGIQIRVAASGRVQEEKVIVSIYAEPKNYFSL
jgi:hypothetical protein